MGMAMNVTFKDKDYPYNMGLVVKTIGLGRGESRISIIVIKLHLVLL